MASNLRAMASNLRAMASNLVDYEDLMWDTFFGRTCRQSWDGFTEMILLVLREAP